MLAYARGVGRTLGTIAMLGSILAAGRAQGFAGGRGEPNNPYQIATAEQLVAIGSDPNLLDKHFVLIADIDLDPNLPGGRVFTEAPIASAVGGVTFFTGTFDGQGHVVRNLTVEEFTRARGYIGLFGCIETPGRVRNLRLLDVRIRAQDEVGGLAGENTGIIENCHVTGSIQCHSGGGGLVGANWLGGNVARCDACVHIRGQEESESLGGLAGYDSGTIVNSRATGSVVGGDRCWGIGGLVGTMGSYGCIVIHERGFVANSYATGEVSGGDRSSNLGGLIGLVAEATVTNCYATGPVTAGTGSTALGGLAGSNGAPGGFGAGPGIHMGTLVNCYSTGAVTCSGNGRIGGLVGYNFDGTIIGCFWDVDRSGRSESEGGTGLTHAEMQEAQIFREAGWDWVDERENGTVEVWFLPEGATQPALTLLSGRYQPPVLPGAGTVDDPYRVSTAEDLGAVAHHDPSARYELADTIDLSGITWSTPPVCDFYGTFEGAGFALVHLRIAGGGHLGLFGVLASGATVADLTVEEADVTGSSHGACVGILAAMNHGRVTHCRMGGRITLGDSVAYVGGLVGQTHGDLTQCCAEVDISADERSAYLGGLAGSSSLVQVRDCYARGTVVVAKECWGIGGLVGDSGVCTIANCYAAAALRGPGSDDFGRLIGQDWDSVVANCCFLISPLEAGPDSPGVARTEEQMRRQVSFAGWDFDKVWMICEGRDYPRLRWEGVQCPP